MNKLFKEKLTLLIIVLIELLLVLFFIRRAVRTPVSVEINQVTSFDAKEDEEVTIGEPFSVHSGAVYEVTVQYSAVANEEGVKPCSLAMYADDGQFSELRQNNLSLNTARNYAYGRVYSEGGGKGGIAVKLIAGNSLSIEKVTIKENTLWQWTKIIVFLILLGIIDFMLVFGDKIWSWLNWNRVAVIAVVFLASLPLFIDYNFSGHDLWYHAIRIDLVAKELADGNFPVRLYSHAYNGFGYAGPIFYGDFFLYFPAVLYSLMFPMEVCIKVLVFVCNLVTVLSSYFLGKCITKNARLGIICSIAYTFSPYRLICIYTRSAIGEFIALSFLPIIALGMYLIFLEKKFSIRNSAILAIGVTCTLMCHVLSVELIMIPMILGCIILWKTTFSKEVFKSLALAVLICIGLSAWYIVPFFHTMFGVGVKAFNSDIECSIQGTGAYLIQLLNPFFPSIGGTSVHSMKDDMSMSLGIGAICGIALSVYLLLDSKIGSKKAVSASVKISFWLGAFCVWMSSIYFPWNFISRVGGNHIAKLVNECQFSCRHLGGATLLLIIAFIYSLKELSGGKLEKIYKGAVGTFIAVCALTSCIFFMNYFGEINANHNYSVSDSSSDYIYNFFSVEGKTAGVGDDVADLELINRCAQVENLTDSEEAFTLPAYAFLNIKVVDAGTGKSFATNKDESGMLAVVIPSGYSGTIQFKYSEPVIWRISELISIITIILLVIRFKKESVGIKKRE